MGFIGFASTIFRQTMIIFYYDSIFVHFANKLKTKLYQTTKPFFYFLFWIFLAYIANAMAPFKYAANVIQSK